MNTKIRVLALIVALIVGNATRVFSQEHTKDGNKTRDAYLRDQVGKIRDNSLKGIDSKAIGMLILRKCAGNYSKCWGFGLCLQKQI
jgi:hypothetical protein